MGHEVTVQENDQQVLTTEIDIYKGASMLKVTDDEQKKLLADFEENQIQVRPDGMIYLPQTFWRQRLNETFGIGQWVIVPKGQHKDLKKNKIYMQVVMQIRGCFVAEAMGEAEYHESNQNQSWATVWESAKSDGITRCCKDLGIASKLWQPDFIKAWLAANAVKVFIKVRKRDGSGDETKTAWRKINAEPFWNEAGIVGQQQNNQQPQPPAPSENPFIKTYKDAKAIEAVLAIAKTKADLNALFKANAAIVKDSTDLQDKFKAREREFKNGGQPVQQPAAQQQNTTSKQKKPLTANLLKQLTERLEQGDISVYDKAIETYTISPADKDTLDKAYIAAKEFEVRIRVVYRKADDLEMLLGMCVNPGQVRAMHEANFKMIDGDAFLTAAFNRRMLELKNSSK